MKSKSSYKINYTKAADKFFNKHQKVRDDYESAIEELINGEHPESIDIKRIKGKRTDYYRIKIGNYRVIHTVINGQVVVINVLLAGARGDVYKKMQGLR
jgi:mRNA interferase RelE/StbE